MLKKIGLSGAPNWDMEAFFNSIKVLEKSEPGLYYVTQESFSLSPKGDFVEMMYIEFDDEKITLEEILDIHFLTFFPTVNSFEADCFFPRCRCVITYQDSEDKFKIDTFLLRVEEKYKGEVVHVKVLSHDTFNKRFVSLTNAEKNLYVKDKENPYCKSRIVPKLDKIKAKYPQYFQELKPWNEDDKNKDNY